MATISTLLRMVDNLYPNAESDNVKVGYMNIALHTMSKYFGKVVEDASIVTVADQDAYDYPAGIEDVTQIVSLALGYSATPETRYSYRKYKLSKSEYHPKSYYSFHEIVSDSGSKKFVLFPTPDESGIPVIIRYNKIIPDLDSNELDAEPAFDKNYHEALVFYCVHMICSSGASPDVVQANVYMQKFDDIIDDLWKSDMEKKQKQNRKPKDNPQWHKHRSWGAGFEDA